ncbi:uncharacterized protein L969DRAFT_355780 [Mixia osmundae IAM 14324]|uniref:Uncharacterized protein n=1 Tax=Mixia osmundae (strain CBS 9802 / IAM 14324 / JCM 22182 / KY 12970) TaxID=764103 RepID=G7E5F2_MIXOS|nr:uncharacterized protein L969DRAFT_355780 [Mixia osmundae IAM 14324]KEI40787.1 hypothetical protein L969DRAFT_355780 [Mixia osmundae IAM 14324]GAA98062.1 hypothetical protein E5Q_04743 [Mixia osmundae IAM 14324]
MAARRSFDDESAYDAASDRSAEVFQSFRELSPAPQSSAVFRRLSSQAPPHSSRLLTDSSDNDVYTQPNLGSHGAQALGNGMGSLAAELAFASTDVRRRSSSRGSLYDELGINAPDFSISFTSSREDQPEDPEREQCGSRVPSQLGIGWGHIDAIRSTSGGSTALSSYYDEPSHDEDDDHPGCSHTPDDQLEHDREKLIRALQAQASFAERLTRYFDESSEDPQPKLERSVTQLLGQLRESRTARESEYSSTISLASTMGLPRTAFSRQAVISRAPPIDCANVSIGADESTLGNTSLLSSTSLEADAHLFAFAELQPVFAALADLRLDTQDASSSLSTVHETLQEGSTQLAEAKRELRRMDKLVSKESSELQAHLELLDRLDAQREIVEGHAHVSYSDRIRRTTSEALASLSCGAQKLHGHMSQMENMLQTLTM